MGGKGWLDEAWTVVLALPFVLCFTPGLQSIAAEGFSILAHVPPWYQAGVGGALAFAFGKDRAASVASRIFKRKGD